MKKRTLCLGLLLLACLFSEGCFWCNRPHLIRRWWWGGCCQPACCGAPACSSCCDGGVMIDHYPSMGAPMQAPTGPTMPGATPLTRAQFPNK